MMSNAGPNQETKGLPKHKTNAELFRCTGLEICANKLNHQISYVIAVVLLAPPMHICLFAKTTIGHVYREIRLNNCFLLCIVGIMFKLIFILSVIGAPSVRSGNALLQKKSMCL